MTKEELIDELCRMSPRQREAVNIVARFQSMVGWIQKERRLETACQNPVPVVEEILKS